MKNEHDQNWLCADALLRQERVEERDQPRVELPLAHQDREGIAMTTLSCLMQTGEPFKA